MNAPVADRAAGVEGNSRLAAVNGMTLLVLLAHGWTSHRRDGGGNRYDDR
jgi:hypothetical protein